MSELIRIRKEYEDLLFLGRFNDTLGATVTGGAEIRYSVFGPLQAGGQGRAVVVVNFGAKPEAAEVKMDGMEGEVTVSAPFAADRKAVLPVELMVPGHTVEVVVKR